MTGLGTARRLRATALWTTTTLGVLLLVRWCAPDLPGTAVPRDFEALVVSGAALALMLCGCWWWLVTTLVVAQVWRGRLPRHTRGVPPVARRLLLAACGVALVGAAAVPAGATPGAVHHGADRPTRASLSGLPLPERPLGGLRAPHAPYLAPASVVVAPGDSLWAIAAARLGPGATDAATTAYCRRLHALNRSTIGPDPDLIRPGQVLVLPTHHLS